MGSLCANSQSDEKSSTETRSQNRHASFGMVFKNHVYFTPRDKSSPYSRPPSGVLLSERFFHCAQFLIYFRSYHSLNASYFKINREPRAFNVCLVHLIYEIRLFFWEVGFPVSNTPLAQVVRQCLILDPIGGLSPGLAHRGKGGQANNLICSVFGQWLLEEISDALDWAALVLWCREIRNDEYIFGVWNNFPYTTSCSDTRVLLAKNMEYPESTMETLQFDLLICWKLLGTKYKHVLWL